MFSQKPCLLLVAENVYLDAIHGPDKGQLNEMHITYSTQLIIHISQKTCLLLVAGIVYLDAIHGPDKGQSNEMHITYNTQLIIHEFPENL